LCLVSVEVGGRATNVFGRGMVVWDQVPVEIPSTVGFVRRRAFSEGGEEVDRPGFRW